MVLDEAQHFLLVRRIGQQVQTNVLGVTMLKAVVELLVVAVIEALLLKLPLKIPVGLGDELEVPVRVLDRRDQDPPVIVGRGGTRPRAPGASEDRIEHQHRHVAAHTVALRGDLRDGVDGRLPQSGRQGVELQHVGPGRKERVATAGKHLSRRFDERRRFASRVVGAAANEVLGMRLDPGMVGRHVVGNEVENEAQAALAQLAPGGGEPRGSAELFIDDVAANAVR